MKHFTIDELMRSGTAIAEGINNRPETDEELKEVESNLQHLIETVLDPVREAWGEPLAVSSGYRCPKLNARLCGAKNSQHMRGEAADVYITEQYFAKRNIKLTDYAAREAEYRRLFNIFMSLVDYDQLIFERSRLNQCVIWIHVSAKRTGKNRHQDFFIQAK